MRRPLVSKVLVRTLEAKAQDPMPLARVEEPFTMTVNDCLKSCNDESICKYKTTIPACRVIHRIHIKDDTPVGQIQSNVLQMFVTGGMRIVHIPRGEAGKGNYQLV